MSDGLSPLAMAKSTLRLLGNKTIEELEEEIEEHNAALRAAQERIEELEQENYELQETVDKLTDAIDRAYRLLP
jgi:predicted nuclease with TOPRIM domain